MFKVHGHSDLGEEPEVTQGQIQCMKWWRTRLWACLSAEWHLAATFTTLPRPLQKVVRTMGQACLEQGACLEDSCWQLVFYWNTFLKLKHSQFILITPCVMWWVWTHTHTRGTITTIQTEDISSPSKVSFSTFILGVLRALYVEDTLLNF